MSDMPEKLQQQALSHASHEIRMHQQKTVRLRLLWKAVQSSVQFVEAFEESPSRQ